MKTLKGMPIVTVEQCARYSETASVIEQQRDKLLTALKDCAEDMECWAAYASEYFQEKHRLQDDIEKYNAIIAEIEAAK